MNGCLPSRPAVVRSAHRRFLGVAAAVGLLLTGSPLAAAASSAQLSATSGSKGVFAIDNDHRTVVFVPNAGGTPRPVTSGLTKPTEIATSRAGSVFVVDGTRLLKVDPHRVVTTIRTGMAPFAHIAVDDNNWLFVLDGTSIFKYSPRDGSVPILVGTGPVYDFDYLTVDAVGNASVTAPNPANYTETLITTYPVRGGKPAVRKLVADYDPRQTEFLDPSHVVEARDGTIYLETDESGGSGATDAYRVPPGPAGPATAYNSKPRFSEYAFNVDSNGHYYLLQNRTWCAAPFRNDGSCVDDYGVDAVQKYDTSGGGRVDTAITGVDLPVGGISVAASGAIYAAIQISRGAGSSNDTAKPQLLRIDAAGGAPVVLASGHFSTPVAENFYWYG